MQAISKRVFFVLVVALVTTVLTACGSQEEKAAKFFKKGQALYEKGDYVKARLEFMNAIQIDRKFGEATLATGKQNHDLDVMTTVAAISRHGELLPEIPCRFENCKAFYHPGLSEIKWSPI
jgi:hypothetical protein